jgi:hypothetical protein
MSTTADTSTITDAGVAGSSSGPTDGSSAGTDSTPVAATDAADTAAAAHQSNPTVAATTSSTSGSTTPAEAAQSTAASATAGTASADGTHADATGTAATGSDGAAGTSTIKTADLNDGHGHDVFVFDSFGAQPVTIQDFHPGEDVLDIAPVLKAAGYTGHDPVADGLLNVVADGDNSTVMLGEVKLATLDHVQPAQVHPSDFWH